ncbi:hypothetical protein CL655_04020 [bacterium]|nr:hypothetical protein [bacterium]
MKLLRRRASDTLRKGLFDRLFTYLHHRSPFDRTLLGALLAIFVIGGLLWLWQYNATHQAIVPTAGGTLQEGIVGAPRFVNPVLAITRADQDMSSLLYRGLYTIDRSGELVPDLAESVTVSEDGRTYNVRLKEDQYWHDGVAITAEDVVYTIGLVQDPELKSPVRGNWNDVTIEPIDTFELNIVLEEPYVPFSENLTLGILPRHLWQGLSADEFPFSQYNTEPVGSGPYQIANIVRSDAGLIEQYQLERFDRYEPIPNIAAVTVHFFADEAAARAALERGDITHTAALGNQSVASLSDAYQVYRKPLPRVFALYPNQNRSAVMRDSAARKALSQAIDREALIAEVLAGFGQATESPLPAGFGPETSTGTSSAEQAVTTLLSGGWVQTEAGGWEKEIDEETVPLAITITTANTELFDATAQFISEAWGALGVEVSVALYEQADLVQAVIRPRDYQLLLFGTEVGRALDYYPFWHSSQREDPGLNIALYTSITTDDYLEDYRVTEDAAARTELLVQFVAELTSETPAIFLFNPEFSYVTRSDTPLTIPDRLNRPSERFATIYDWHIESESLWPIFIE